MLMVCLVIPNMWKISYEVSLGKNHKVLTQMQIIMQIMQGELVLHYLVLVYRDFDDTKNIKHMQVPMSRWRQQSKNNW